MNVITGGGGLLGSHLATRLVFDNKPVRIVDNFADGQMENIAVIRGRIDTKWGDICRLDFLIDAFKGADIVYHLAAQTDPARSWEFPEETSNVNIGGTQSVLRACSVNKVKRLVFASCGNIYGYGDNEPRKETTPFRPGTPLAISKMAAEHYCLSWGETHGMDITCLRIFELYGKCSSSPNRLIMKMLAGEEVTLPPQTLDFVYVEDAVDACLNCNVPLMNVGTGVGHTYEQVTSILDGLLESPLERSTGDLGDGEPEYNVADTSLAQELGFIATDLATGLQRSNHVAH